MNSLAALNSTLQVIAALLIFVASYLGFVLCAILCLVVAESISERASLVRDYGVRHVSLKNNRVSSETHSETHRSWHQYLVFRH
jgi:hypothetical protein